MATSGATTQDNIKNNNALAGISFHELLQADKMQQEAENKRLQKQFCQESPQPEDQPVEKQQSENKQSKKQHLETQQSEKNQRENIQNKESEKQLEKQNLEKKPMRNQSPEKQQLGKKTPRMQSPEKQQLEKKTPPKQKAEKQEKNKSQKQSPEKQRLEHKASEKSSTTQTQKSTNDKSGLEELLAYAGNKHCADCCSPEPKWVSMCAGVFICIKCSGVHRSLGVHITKVLSVNLDDWTEDQVSGLAEMGGNIGANRKYEACLPANVKKPKPDSSIEERSDFIRKKYELQQFVLSDESISCPFPRPSSSYQCHSAKNMILAIDKKHIDKQVSNLRISGIGQAFRNSWKKKEDTSRSGSKKSDSAPGMIEFVGLIKVNVVKGTNLAIRDMVSSDPYVILSLGGQSVKTRVIKNNLNPVWNEKLMLSIPDCIPPLKLLVYDKDTFTTDDFMGQADIDIQPLVSAAQACEKSSGNETTHIGKWLATKDNTLVKDSIITLKDGTVRQEMSIRLQNVERGVLDLELECVPLTQ